MKCYECGKEMIPVPFGPHPVSGGEEVYCPKGRAVDGEIWVKCPDGHRGAWVEASGEDLQG